MAEKRTKKPKLPTFVTPKGTARWAYLTKPDTQFNAEGDYKVTLVLPKDDADTEALLSKLKPLHNEAVKQAKDAFAKNPKNKNKKFDKKINPFFTDETDDNGDATGNVLINFKRKASGTREDGSSWTAKPDLFDVKGVKLDPSARVFGGSKIKVQFAVKIYDSPAFGAGISLMLNGVQVIKLVDGERDAGSYGFGDESDDEDSDVDSTTSDDTDTDTETGDGTTEAGQAGDDF